MVFIPDTVYGLCITFPVLAIAAVAGRLYARRVQKASLQADDWLILFALLCSICTGVLGFIASIYGDLGKRQPLGPNGLAKVSPKIDVYIKVQYASKIIGIGALGGAKLSLLLFYRRVFSVGSFRKPFYVIFGINMLWVFVYLFVYSVPCVPMSQYWSKLVSDKRNCSGVGANYSYAITNVILDATILILPLPFVWRLQLSLAQKLAITGIFMLGVIVTVIGIVKTWAFFTFGQVLLHDSRQETYDGAPLFYYTIAENCLAVIGACLPTLRPVFHGWSVDSLVGSLRSFSLHSLRLKTTPSGSRTRVAHSSKEDDSFVELTDVPSHSFGTVDGDAVTETKRQAHEMRLEANK